MIILIVAIGFLTMSAVGSYHEATRNNWHRARTPFKWENFNWLFPLGAMVVGAIIGFVITLGVIENTHDKVPIETNLAALSDGTSASGSFFLGSGSVEERPVFFYYAEVNGNYYLKHVRADTVTVRMTNGEPRMVRYCGDYTTAPGWVKWPLSDNFWEGSYIECAKRDQTVFYVPEGSIQSNYILDAQ